MSQSIKTHLKSNAIIYFWLVLGTIVTLYHFSYFPLWQDESFSANAAREGFLRIIDIAKADTHPPLHIFLLKISGLVFGFNEFGMRFPSLVFYLLTLIASYLLLKQSQIKQWQQAIAVGIIATNPVMLFYAAESRSYTMLACMTVFTVLFFQRLILNQWNKTNILGFILSSTILLYTHSLGLVISACLVIYFGFKALVPNFISSFGLERYVSKFSFKKALSKIKQSPEKTISKLEKENHHEAENRPFGAKFKDFWKNTNLSKFLLIFSLVILLYLPWFLVFLKQYTTVSDKGFWLTFDPVKDLFNVPPTMFINQGYSTNFPQMLWIGILPAIGLPLLFLGIFYNLFKKPKIWFWVFMIFTIAIYLISFKNPLFYIRYLIFIVPFGLLTLTDGLNFLRAKLSRTAALILGIILIAGSISFHTQNVMQNYGSKADYPMLVREIKANYPNLLVLHPEAFSYHSFKFYNQDEQIQTYVFSPKRSLPYLQGTSVLDDSDYYPGDYTDLAKLSRIGSVYLWKNSDFEDGLTKLGFKKVKNQEIPNGLHFDVWEKSELTFSEN